MGRLPHRLVFIYRSTNKGALTWVNPCVYKARAESWLRAPERMQIKKVYVNDVLVGEAATWAEVYRLLGLQGVHFMGKPGAAEGPSAFYLSGTVSRSQEKRLRSAEETA